VTTRETKTQVQPGRSDPQTVFTTLSAWRDRAYHFQVWIPANRIVGTHLFFVSLSALIDYRNGITFVKSESRSICGRPSATLKSWMKFPYAARGIRSGMLGVGAVTRFDDFEDSAARMSYQ
jgi:hypothetical protein